MNKDHAALVHEALLRHDGRSLCPDWPREKQDQLTEALDDIRFGLRLKRKQQKSLLPKDPLDLSDNFKPAGPLALRRGLA